MVVFHTANQFNLVVDGSEMMSVTSMAGQLGTPATAPGCARKALVRSCGQVSSRKGPMQNRLQHSRAAAAVAAAGGSFMRD